MREQRCVINDNPLDGLNEDSDNELYIPPPRWCGKILYS